jgi:serine/threonine-protein kinase
MPSIKIKCEGCGTTMKAPESMAGGMGTCPTCGRYIRVPERTSSTENLPVIVDPAAPKDPNLGKVLGSEYEVNAFIGAGAYARVYAATQKSTSRTVAVKIMSGPQLNDTRLNRLRREAATLMRLSHRNIVQVYATGGDESCYWYAMEFIEGGDVARRLKIGPVPWQTAYAWLKQSLAGLQVAHENGVVHRDLKPQNLMLAADGTIRVADFGLVKVDDNLGNLTKTGRIVGTPMYMSPEPAMGKEVDGRSDIYSLGATFYHVFCGRPMFPTADAVTLLIKHVQETPEPMEQAAPTVPLPVCWAVERMLEKAPVRRYQSAAVALADLESYEKSGELIERTPGGDSSDSGDAQAATS